MPAGVQRRRYGGAKALLLHTRLPRLQVLAGYRVFCSRLMRSKSSLSSNVYAVSHGIRSPKALVAGSKAARLLAGANRAAPVPP